MAAILEPAGSGVAGTQTRGVTKQYQASATGSSSSGLETITPYDSGTILGHVQPGGSGEKLVSGVVQRASQLLVDGTDASGNFLKPTFSSLNTDPTPPSGSTAADGLSQAPQHE